MTPRPVRAWLVVYDIADNRRRTKMAKWFEARGERVQESVFELTGPPEEVERWLAEARAPRRFDESVDSLRAYSICSACAESTRTWGLGPPFRTAGKAVIA
jgi:CRISPR-associated protein Cas2